MIKSKKLSRFKNIKHAFFNRLGGRSKGIYKSLNCGPGSLDKKKMYSATLRLLKKRLTLIQKK